MENHTKQYIIIVRNGSHYEPAMTTASGCVWLLSNTKQQLAQECMNSDANLGMNNDDVFCEIGALPSFPRVRLRVKISNDIRMKDIYHMKPGELFTDIVLTGFLGILNYKYTDTMDFSNTYFLEKVKGHNYSPDYVSFVMRMRLKNKTIFDLDNYFVLNHIPPNHGG